MTLLRPLEPSDSAKVLDLNARNVELLAPMDQARLEQLTDWTDRADAIVCEGELAGFVLTFAPGTAYDSANYRWFGEHLADGFYYLDRIVLDERFRRRGLGARVYDELERTAAAYGRMVLEVNVDPPNEPSLAFHRGRGYADLAELGESGKKVLLMEKLLGFAGSTMG